jgi:hypothetical protein
VHVTEVSDIIARPTSTEWTPAQKERLKQENLFHERRPLEKVPYDFHAVWKDGEGDQHKSMIIAWELLETYRQYRSKYADPIQKMREKWLGDLFGAARRVSFFMGNLAKRRQVFCVCGWFVPPREVADSGLLWSG